MSESQRQREGSGEMKPIAAVNNSTEQTTRAGRKKIDKMSSEVVDTNPYR